MQSFFIQFNVLFLLFICPLSFVESSQKSVSENQHLLALRLIRSIRSQNQKETLSMIKSRPKKKQSWYKPVRLLTSGLINYYQKFISSQDMPVCNFTPSCSRFGQMAIQRYGLIRGCLLIGDRLFRCNSLSYQHHTIHLQTGLCHDPITDYQF